MIITAIIARNKKEFNDRLKIAGSAHSLQLDVMDGKFVPDKSLQFSFERPTGYDSVEAHLMVQDPETWIRKNIRKVDTVLVHIETCTDPLRIIGLVKKKGKRIGFVLNPETPVEKIVPYLNEIDQVLFMTVHPGKYGARFLPYVLKKVHLLRRRAPHMDIEVDGGITSRTIKKSAKAGANKFVSGSYILKSKDPERAREHLSHMVKNMIGKTAQLKRMADKLRIHSINETTTAGSGHPTSCMSCAEIMSTLFFDELNHEDEFILSKGHAAPILWAAYAEAGFIPLSDLKTLRKITSPLEGHPTPRMPMIKIATGSLGQGLSAGVGMALAKRIKGEKGRIYVLLGDGESAEGSVWEAANTAAYNLLNNLCAIIDANRLGQSQQTMHGHRISNYVKKFKAFGWDAVAIDGHDITQIKRAFARSRKSNRPFAIIAKTLKGKGFKEVQNKEGWHGKPFNIELREKAFHEIGSTDIRLHSNVSIKREKPAKKDFCPGNYRIGDMVATRNAFGSALLSLGKADPAVVAIDGDVRNSTMTQDFFDAFPRRSFESFIAEQNMAGMAAGMSAMGLRPFVATFAAFLTRAHDFIRMARYSDANIKFAGSHVGVSIGEDGPSQMGLEDIPMFLSMPDSVVLYPSDAVSAERLVREMAFHEGISYMRTTREKTPVIYNNNEKFPIGKYKVLRRSSRDSALVIAAGVTLHEAIKAYELLKKKNINIRVIDLYSIKPVDSAGLLKNAKECKGNVIVVEDHYDGGIGPVVSSAVGRIKHLRINDVPRSGKPEELRKKYEIDAEAIVKAVKTKR